MLSVAIRGETMIASATTGARRQAIHAPARNTTAVAASSTALPTTPVRLSWTSARYATAGVAARTALGIANCARARRNGLSWRPSCDTRYAIHKNAENTARISATPIHFQPDWVKMGARSEAGSDWIHWYGIIQPPPVVTSSWMFSMGTGRTWGRARMRS